jgi:CO/xanthine dehydrogenase FAD-binding subunit
MKRLSKGMIQMKINEYVVPNSIEEAYNIFINHSNNAVIGGGAWMKLASNKTIETLIDLKALGLNQIIDEEDALIVGANVTLHELENNSLINTLYDGIICQAIQGIMGVNVRNVATIGGSVMGRFSFCDLYPVLMAVNCELEFYHQGRISLERFLQEKRFEKDILQRVIIPKKSGRGFYKKVKRTALDFAILNVCVVKMDGLKIVVGARPGTAKEAVKTAQYLNQHTVDEDTLEKAMDIMLKEMSFSSNVRASESYRSDLAKVYVKRGINEVIS